MRRSLYLLVPFISGFVFNSYADFYVGPKVGGSFNVGSYSSHDTTDADNVHSAAGGAGASVIGGLAFGYDYLVDSMYIALDGSILANNLDNEVRLSANANGEQVPAAFLKNQFNYGLALQLGYKLHNDAIPFVSLGGLGGKYQLKVKNTSAAAARGISANTEKTIEKNVFGFAVGGGVKFAFNESWLGVAQYEYATAKKLSEDFTDNADAPAKWNYSNEIKQHNVTFALVYKF